MLGEHVHVYIGLGHGHLTHLHVGESAEEHGALGEPVQQQAAQVVGVCEVGRPLAVELGHDAGHQQERALSHLRHAVRAQRHSQRHDVPLHALARVQAAQLRQLVRQVLAEPPIAHVVRLDEPCGSSSSSNTLNTSTTPNALFLPIEEFRGF